MLKTLLIQQSLSSKTKTAALILNWRSKIRYASYLAHHMRNLRIAQLEKEKCKKSRNSGVIKHFGCLLLSDNIKVTTQL